MSVHNFDDGDIRLSDLVFYPSVIIPGVVEGGLGVVQRARYNVITIIKRRG